MLKERTLTELRKLYKGRIYIWVGNKPKDIRRFVEDAEEQGYRFGKIKPTESGGANIVALEKNKQLSYVGFAGHIAIQGESCELFHKIDYKKFVDGKKDYFFKNK